jgi:hypothetical protein
MSNDYSGKWAGQYTLGEGYAPSMTGITTSFELIMEIIDGVLKGHCRDNIEDVPMSAPATIEGFIEDNFINFVKRYPHAWMRDENGDMVEDVDQPSHEVIYNGYFGEGLVQGDWEIVASTHVNPDGTLYEYLLRGTWYMKKV